MISKFLKWVAGLFAKPTISVTVINNETEEVVKKRKAAPKKPKAAKAKKPSKK